MAHRQRQQMLRKAAALQYRFQLPMAQLLTDGSALATASMVAKQLQGQFTHLQRCNQPTL